MWLASLLALVLSVSPAVSFAPATVSITVRVEPNEKARLLVWSLVSEEWGQSSQRSIEPAEKIKTYVLPVWKGVPAGEYTAEALVIDSAGKVIQRDSKRVLVKGMEMP